MDEDAKIKFCIYDKSRPIIVPIQQRFSFIQEENDIAYFEFSLDKKYNEVDFDINLHFGDIKIFYSNDPSFYSKSDYMEDGGQRKFSFRHSDATSLNGSL